MGVLKSILLFQSLTMFLFFVLFQCVPIELKFSNKNKPVKNGTGKARLELGAMHIHKEKLLHSD